MATDQNFYLEFQKIGNAVKVTAIDPASLEEVSIVAPQNATQAEMTRIAIQKLRRKLQTCKMTVKSARQSSGKTVNQRGILV